MGRYDLSFAGLAEKNQRLRNSEEVQLALRERALLEEARRQYDELEALYERGAALKENGFDMENICSRWDD